MENFKRAYHEAFPECERRPWPSVLTLLQSEPRYRLLAADASGHFTQNLSEAQTFATVWDLGAFCYMEHFVSAKEVRGKGLGAKMLANIIAACGDKPLVIEVEPAPTGHMAQRRIAFYQRCGFTAFPDYEYIQPPYSPSLQPVPLMLMAANADGKHLDLNNITNTIHRIVYGVDDTVKMC